MGTKTSEKLAVVGRRALSIALVFTALFLLFSLLTFDSGDLSHGWWPQTHGFRNVGGRLGAAAANFMMLHFGYAAYIAVLLAGGFALRCRILRDTVEAWLGILGCLLILASSAVLFQLIAPGTSRLPGGGGVVGVAGLELATHYAGPVGAWLLPALFLCLGGLLMSLDKVAEWAGVRLLARAKDWVDEWRKQASAAKTARKSRKKPKAEPPIKTHRPKQAPEAQTTAVQTAPDVAPADTAGPAKDKPTPAKKKAAGGKESNIEQIAAVPSRVVDGGYELPPLDLLDPAEPVDEKSLEKLVRENSRVLEQTLSEFGIGAQVVGIEKGPTVTRYEMALAPGIKVNRVTGLSNDIAMAVKAPSVRVVAPIPGKSTVGIEVPNAIKETVRLIELMTCDEFRLQRDRMILPIMLGKDASGAPIVTDLARMPHLLIAGATGSGKSVCLSSFIVTNLMLHRPENIRMILVDPKMVDLGLFEGIPHLLTPVVTNMKRAPHVLEWATRQMDERYDWLARAGVRHISQYNQLGEEGLRERLGDDFDYEDEDVPFHMPYVVIVVDELADMMMVASKQVEVSITRLAQKSRAVGIHIILATQRPSVDVITGLIKSNLPTRVSFQVTSKVDSRTILDQNGAEQLLGSGDLLFIPPGTSDLIRVQGTFVSDNEIKRVTQFARSQGDPAYLMNVKQLGRAEEAEPENEATSPLEEYSPDELYDDACRVVLEFQRGSVSLLQRKLEIGYTRAARLIEMMAAEGIVGAYKGSKARQVLMKLHEWEEMRGIPPEQRTATPPEEEQPIANDG